MAYNYDKTKENIRADELDESERKKWLNTFKEKGGKIIKEYDDTKNSKGKDDHSSASNAKGSIRKRPVREVKLPSELEREKLRIQNERIARKRAAEEARQAALSNFWSRLQIHIKAWMAGVSPLKAAKANFKTMKLIVDQGKRAVMELNILGTDLFISNPAIAKKIISALDKQDKIYMEVLERGQKLYKNKIFDALSEALSNAGQRDVELEFIKEPLIEFYRDLYYLYPYYNTYLKAAELAIKIQGEEIKSRSALSSDKRKKIRKEILFLFNILFEKIYFLVLKADMKLYPPFSADLEKAIGIKQEDKIGKGNYTKKSEESENAEDSEKDESENEIDNEDGDSGKEEADKDKDAEKNQKEEQLPREVVYGQKLMDMYKLEFLRKKHDKDSKSGTSGLAINDKNYLTYLFLKEFDFEYSFVLTTNKIKLRVDYSAGSKIDYHQMLMDHYDTLQNTLNLMKVYSDTVRELEKVKKNPTSSNYIQNTKNITQAENKRNQASRNFRSMSKETIKNITEALLLLIQDMKGQKKIVENMNDPIKFDIRVEGQKRLNGKTVAQCIMEAYCYSYALFERLDSGDLFGGIIEMSEEEFKRSFGQAQWDAFANPDKTSSTDTSSKKEVIHELDEIDEIDEIDMDTEINEDEL